MATLYRIWVHPLREWLEDMQLISYSDGQSPPNPEHYPLVSTSGLPTYAEDERWVDEHGCVARLASYVIEPYESDGA